MNIKTFHYNLLAVFNRIVKVNLGSAQFGEKCGINSPGASVTKKEALKILNFAKYSGIK